MSVPKHGMPSGTLNPQFRFRKKSPVHYSYQLFFCSNMIPTHLFCNTFKMSDTCINMTNHVGGMHVMDALLHYGISHVLIFAASALSTWH